MWILTNAAAELSLWGNPRGDEFVIAAARDQLGDVAGAYFVDDADLAGLSMAAPTVQPTEGGAELHCDGQVVPLEVVAIPDQ